MKKTFYTLSLVAFMLMLSFQSFAQSQRMFLAEVGTQASCPPCQPFNASLDPILDANEDKVVALKYQTSWPGFDQMNLDNPTEVADRVSYYGFSGVPNGIANGTSGGTISQATIDASYAQTAAFDMSLTASVENNVLVVNGLVTGNEDVTGDLKLRIALAEKTITIDDAPGGTNGETEYHHVLKKFLTGSAGTTLEGTWAAGDTYEISETLDLSSLTIYQYGQLEVVAFIQNDATKEVYQAAKTSEVDVVVSFTNNAGVLEVLNLPTGFCPGEQSYSPTIKIVNGGNDNLTSADIVYTINGSTPQTYAYTGDLGTLAQETVVLDPILFFGADENIIEVTITNPNGASDEDSSDDATTASIDLSPFSTTEITITLNTDCWGNETSYELRKLDGTVVTTGNGFGNEAESIETLSLDANDCYEFFLYDTYGDGMNGSQWANSCSTDGTLVITDDMGNELLNYDGTTEFSELKAGFTTTPLSSVNELTEVSEIVLAPNPTSDRLNVSFSLTEAIDMEVVVYNVVGQRVAVLNQALNAGVNQFEIDASSYANGVYFINFNSEEGTKTAKFTVSK